MYPEYCRLVDDLQESMMISIAFDEKPCSSRVFLITEKHPTSFSSVDIVFLGCVATLEFVLLWVVCKVCLPVDVSKLGTNAELTTLEQVE